MSLKSALFRTQSCASWVRAHAARETQLTKLRIHIGSRACRNPGNDFVEEFCTPFAVLHAELAGNGFVVTNRFADHLALRPLDTLRNPPQRFGGIFVSGKGH